MRRLLAALPLLVVCVAQPAQAAPVPATVGWWYELQQLPALLPVKMPAPPYVPDGDLLVEGTASGAVAVAAVNVLLPSGQLAKVLTVPVVSTRGTPAVEVCKTLSGWAAASAGTWEERPVCDGGSITMMPSADGMTLSADVSTLTKEGALDVLLSPVSSQTTSVTLGRVPSLTYTAAPAPVVSASSEPLLPTEAPTAPAIVAPVAPPPEVQPVVPGLIPPVAATPETTLAAPQVVQPVAPRAAPLAAVSSTQGRDWALWLLLLTGMTGFLLARRRHDPGAVRGIGRYRTERTGDPSVRV